MNDSELLAPDEVLLTGRWLGEGAARADDEVERRIRWLVTTVLEVRGTSTDGWDWLFADPADGRLWELTFPSGSLHGSGPRRLAVIEREAAARKYAPGREAPS